MMVLLCFGDNTPAIDDIRGVLPSDWTLSMTSDALGRVAHPEANPKETIKTNDTGNRILDTMIKTERR
jgi:hypothetical protein